MKKINLISLTLENFKCHKNLELRFDGADASIYGDNATGKTSVYDALTWLLFGKDARGNGEKVIDIKPLDDQGRVLDHDALTAVEAVLEVVEDVDARNGRANSLSQPAADSSLGEGAMGRIAAGRETVVLRRTLREVWTTRRGDPEPVYTGNTSEYFVDGVPLIKREFDARVAMLVNEDVFRALTSVTYFSDELEWKRRRATLFDLLSVSGETPTEEALLQEPRFSAIREVIGKRSLDELRKMLQAQKKGLDKDGLELPARISEMERTARELSALDYGRAEQELELLRVRRETVQADYAAIKDGGGLAALRTQCDNVQNELDRLNNENERHRMEQRAKLPNPESFRLQISREERHVRMLEEDIGKAAQNEALCVRSIDAERKRWIQENDRSFNGGNCPTCGQALPVEQLKAAVKRFDEQKAASLARIEQAAAEDEARMKDIQARILAMEKERKQAEDELEALHRRMEEAAAAQEAVDDLDGYAEQKAALEAKIAELRAQRAAEESGLSDRKLTLTKELAEISAEIEKNEKLLSRREVLAYTRQRIEALREQAKESAEELERLERLLLLIEELVRVKAARVEAAVNELFRVVRFRLFREQANGGLEERCDVTVDGVPYISLNSGMKTNAGIDVINTLSAFYGVSVPLVIDNAESVTRLEETDAQVIRLVVSEHDRVLRLER